MEVMFLDGTDFNGILNIPECMQKPVMVMVMSDTCGHCVRAKPTFEDFARMYQHQCVCCKVDVDDERGQVFLRKIGYNLQGVPDFLKFVKGKRVYQSVKGRTIDDFINFMK